MAAVLFHSDLTWLLVVIGTLIGGAIGVVAHIDSKDQR